MVSSGLEKQEAVDSPQPNDDGEHAARRHAECDELHRQFQSAGIKLSRDLLEKIYLPHNSTPYRSIASNSPEVKDFRKGLGTPAPVALVGFLICLSPLACDLMGWRGAGGNGAAGMGSYFFFGGLLMILGGLLEFIVGKTFSFVVFCSFGGFWLTIGTTLQPFYNVGAAYATAPNTTSLEQGFATVGFTASYGFFQVFMALLCFIYFICSFRTNIVNVFLFFFLTIAFCLLAAVNWVFAEIFAGDVTQIHKVHRIQVAAGAFLFMTCIVGWYSFFAIMLKLMDFPFQIPIGELSGLVESRTERMKKKSNIA
ncbi:putative gpr1 fun34 -class plasma membrane protein [Erysiphe necator]|uniref:Putative gpr1 fun34-class plasma membrane protein n=1 Tax=Uncinula necator TaxID=52586 RepID=A0A0B1P6S5_UNCNE|nr:putative gpr1 fun34 -class plasma membrane protein [Erysiphe necator]